MSDPTSDTTGTLDREQVNAILDGLPPTDYLILEVLAARYRTGENAWTFPARLTPVLRRLEKANLAWWKTGPVERTCLAGLTDYARAGVLSPTYVTPDQKEVVALHAEVDVLTGLITRRRETAASEDRAQELLTGVNALPGMWERLSEDPNRADDARTAYRSAAQDLRAALTQPNSPTQNKTR